MKVAIAVALSAVAAGVFAKPATKYSRADWKKYHCLTLDKYLTWQDPCTHNCLQLTLNGHRDGCNPDDHVCHCRHTQKALDILIPCITSPTSPNATCSQAQIGAAVAIVDDLCGFYNATGYDDYVGCNPKLTEEVYEDIFQDLVEADKCD